MRGKRGRKEYVKYLGELDLLLPAANASAAGRKVDTNSPLSPLVQLYEISRYLLPLPFHSTLCLMESLRGGRSASFRNSPSAPLKVSLFPSFLSSATAIAASLLPHLSSSPVVNLELPRSSTAATHYVVRRLPFHPRFAENRTRRSCEF